MSDILPIAELGIFFISGRLLLDIRCSALLLWDSKTPKPCLYIAVYEHHGLSLRPMRLKLCIHPLLMRALDISHIYPGSAAVGPAKDALFYHFGCQKIIEGGIFQGLDRSQNLLSDLDLGGSGALRFDLRGYHRPKIAKIVILPSLKDEPQIDNRGRSRPRSLIDL